MPSSASIESLESRYSIKKVFFLIFNFKKKFIKFTNFIMRLLLIVYPLAWTYLIDSLSDFQWKSTGIFFVSDFSTKPINIIGQFVKKKLMNGNIKISPSRNGQKMFLIRTFCSIISRYSKSANKQILNLKNLKKKVGRSLLNLNGWTLRFRETFENLAGKFARSWCSRTFQSDWSENFEHWNIFSIQKSLQKSLQVRTWKVKMV